MGHLSNILDPDHPYARKTFFAMDSDHATREREWQSHLDWINANVRGRPKATATYTVEQLEAMGMIGIYKQCS